ncbi:hypothetical protein DC1_00023 [Burkholderia phage DC1]|uniref:Uncharacterized protein n=1 Tax=Burkholderia phage DC1 TaxID=2881398 RepID=I6NV31_9CAUD|nr:hypothetical protein B862_gp60 [Burkholderia phage DC1]AEZ50841.1 hypothetical protein DC1_00023 [Burkholderia phage DC1]
MEKKKVEIARIPLPDELGEALAGALGLTPGAEQEPMPLPFTAADSHHARALIEAARQPRFELGDVVVLRPHAHDSFKWPQPGEKCIVTQVLETPVRTGQHGSAMFAKPGDFAIAMISPDGELMEFMHDSRDFEKVGSINN